MFGDRSRIRKVAIVENGAAMLPKASVVEMALVLSNVLFAPLFAFNEIDKVYGFIVRGRRSKGKGKGILGASRKREGLACGLAPKFSSLSLSGWGGGVLPYKKLIGKYRWRGSHFHDWSRIIMGSHFQ